MTREQIEQMPAGREMDTLIAERVLGWTFHPSSFEQAEPSEWRKDGRKIWAAPFTPSVNIAAAWEVFDPMHVPLEKSQEGTWLVYRPERKGETGEWLGITILGRADTAPLAICRAALILALHE
jgi:hypothetical protein